MRYILIPFIVFLLQNTYSQTPLDTIGFPIKKAYKICLHSTNDTIFSCFFQYNDKHQLIRLDKLKKGDSFYNFMTYNYDSLGRRITEEQHVVFRFYDGISSNQSNWANNIIGIYGGGNTYKYDTVKKEIIIHLGEKAINSQNYDSIFKGNKLIALFDKNDTTTFEYDSKGRLIFERANKYNRKTLKIYKYKKNEIYISTYKINNRKQLISRTYLKYFNNQLIQKNEIEIVDNALKKWYRPRLKDYYNNTTYTYKDNRLVSFKKESFTSDNGADECGANFIEIYNYE